MVQLKLTTLQLQGQAIPHYPFDSRIGPFELFKGFPHFTNTTLVAGLRDFLNAIHITGVDTRPDRYPWNW
jgi:hypothetical protein